MFAKFRVLNSMGTFLDAFSATQVEDKVGLSDEESAEAKEKDSVPEVE